MSRRNAAMGIPEDPLEPKKRIMDLAREQSGEPEDQRNVFCVPKVIFRSQKKTRLAAKKFKRRFLAYDKSWDSAHTVSVRPGEERQSQVKESSEFLFGAEKSLTDSSGLLSAIADIHVKKRL
jgi:hypothetical protein